MGNILLYIIMSRKASHAGSWYSENKSELTDQLNNWYTPVKIQNNIKARAIIAPHAGLY